MSFSDDDRRYLEELIDREKIRDCLMRYCNGIDRRDAEMVKSAYWPDSHDIHGDFDGNGHDFVDWVMPNLRKLKTTQHFIGNILIRIDGNFAKVEAYSRNWHTFRNAAGRLHDVIQGHRYLDKMEKRGSEWRVIDRICIYEWILENPESIDFSNGALGQDSAPAGTSKPNDALYTFLGGMPIGGYLGQPA